MELPSTSVRSAWPSSSRTADGPVSPNPEFSSGNSSVPPSALSSPWAGPASLPSSSHYSVHQHPSSDHHDTGNMHSLANIFSAPLDPAVFATLAANGVLGPLAASHPASGHPNSAYPPSHIARNTGPINIPSGNISHPPSSSAWGPSSLPYSGNRPYPGRPAVPRVRSSTTGQDLQSATGKPHPYSSYPGVQPRSPLEPSSSGHDERTMPPQGRRLSLLDQAPIHSHQLGPGPGHYDSNKVVPAQSSFEPKVHYGGATDQSNIGLPPSLWMSPAVTHDSHHSNHPSQHSSPSLLHQLPSSRRSSVHSPVSPRSSVDAKSGLLSDLFSEDLFASTQGTEPSNSRFTPPRLSGSPDLQQLKYSAMEPEELAKTDPLATQVWRMYANTKANLPQAQRMENLSWRMMALALKKQKDDEEKEKGSPPVAPATSEANEDGRGRSSDKGRTVRVVGFEADGDIKDEPE